MSVVSTRLQLTIRPEMKKKSEIQKKQRGSKNLGCCCIRKPSQRHCCRWSIIHLNFIIFWWVAAPLVGLYHIFFFGTDFTTNGIEKCLFGQETNGICSLFSLSNVSKEETRFPTKVYVQCIHSTASWFQQGHYLNIPHKTLTIVSAP